jgi:hypothetical protein
MSFVLRDRWHCTFMEEDLRTKAAPPRTFTNPDNMVEMIRRGNGFRDLASKQAAEHAIIAGSSSASRLNVSSRFGYSETACRTDASHL